MNPCSGEPLAALDAIGDPGSTTVELTVQGKPVSLAIVRHTGKVYGYLNVCPHLGTPLDWNPGEVLDRERSAIICATHGARFRIRDGRCISGPCLGDRLSAVPLCVQGGMIHLAQTRTSPDSGD